MQEFQPDFKVNPSVLATDLDGTLIPLEGDAADIESLAGLRHLRGRGQFKLVFATGRHFESVLGAIDTHNLPQPDWLVCDVGTSIYKSSGQSFAGFTPYETHLEGLVQSSTRVDVESALTGIEGLEFQKPDNQKRFKISYLCSPEAVDAMLDTVNRALRQSKLPFTCMGSIDPYKSRGMLDVLPTGVSKASALLWLSTHADFSPDAVIYAGDSGNDQAALESGFRAIVVANASKGLAESVLASLSARGLEQRLFLASKNATSGVLQGCLHFGLAGMTPA